MHGNTHNNSGTRNSNFIWKMQLVHINRPVHTKSIHDVDQNHVNDRHYVPWLSLIAVEIDA